MAMPTFTMRQLLEAGVHFGHSTRRWNPSMAPYLFGARNNIHIIDLQQTVPMLYDALGAVRGVVANGGRVLFVGTKRAAAERVADAAKRCGQYYVNHRWLGGMMTNWTTMSRSIKRLRDVDTRLEGEESLGLTKKELLQLTRERDKLDRALGGIREMGGLPDILFVIDTNKESIAVAEAKKLGIPVVAVVDSNSNPNGINFPIPGNDDAQRAISLYCDLLVAAVLDGLQQEMTASGVDAGEQTEPTIEPLPGETVPSEAAAEPQAALLTDAEIGLAQTEEAAEAATAAEKAADGPAETPASETPASEPPAPETETASGDVNKG